MQSIYSCSYIRSNPEGVMEYNDVNKNSIWRIPAAFFLGVEIFLLLLSTAMFQHCERVVKHVKNN